MLLSLVEDYAAREPGGMSGTVFRPVPGESERLLDEAAGVAAFGTGKARGLDARGAIGRDDDFNRLH
jgi:hypothetical protein